MGFTHYDKVSVKRGLFTGKKGFEVPICPSNPVVNCTAATLSVTAKEHANGVIALNKAAGTAVTMPAATGSGHKYTFVAGTKFTSAATIKTVSGDVFVGYALLAANTLSSFDTTDTTATITLDGGATGGFSGACVELVDIAENTWWVRYISIASEPAATPFS